MLDRPRISHPRTHALCATPRCEIPSLPPARRPAGWLAGIGIAACLACVTPAGGGLYSYTQIADNTSPSIDLLFPAPAINGSGFVAFYTVDSGGPVQGNIYVGNGANKFVQQGSPPAALIASSGGALGAIDPFSQLSISGPGDVVFQTSTTWSGGGRYRIVRYDAVGTFTTIASVNSDIDQVGIVAHPSINNAGAAAFVGFGRETPTASWTREFIMHGNGGPTGFSAVADGLGFEYVDAPSLRRDGPAFEVAFTASGPGRSAVYKVSGLNLTSIADTDNSDFVQVTGASMDDLGRVAFVGARASGVRGIYVHAGASLKTHADSTGAYDTFGPVASSLAGAAFQAERDVQGSGVYAGPDPITDRVIEVGDSLPGYPSKVKSVWLGREGYNNVGQVAMMVEFLDGTQRILRADPLAIFTSSEDALGDLAMAMVSKYRSAAEQDVPTPSGVGRLALEYLFMTTEGVLEILVNDMVVARVPAPDAIADGFASLETPVDPRVLFPAPPSELTIALRLSSPGAETGLLVNNVRFPGLVDGDFQAGDLRHWRTEVTDGGAVGLALAPPGRVVPEPATVACVALATAGLGAYVRRRRKP